MPDLSHFLSISDLQPFFDDACDRDNVTDAWRKRYSERLESIMEPRLSAFFEALKAEGRMIPIPNSEGYGCRLWDAWNAVATMTDETSVVECVAILTNLSRQFAHRFVFEIIYPYERVLTDQGIEAAQAFDKTVPFKKQISRFNAGNFESFHFSNESCRETALSLILSFENWVPEGSFIGDKGIEPIAPLPKAAVLETVVNLKTGNLLVNDWFRIAEFTEVVDEDFPINSRKGREDQTRHYAEKFGFISVCVGNTCPGVYQDDNTIVVGYHDEDESLVPANLVGSGNVCTDLGAATLIEYETLVEIVSRKLPDTAKAVVDTYLDSLDTGSYGLHRIKVAPGTYYLYHFGYYSRFAEMAKAAGIPLDQSIDEPYFILSKERLLSASRR